MTERCSKCRTDDHQTKGCLKPWPSWDKQECDMCGQSPTHDKEFCPEKWRIIQDCQICGHLTHNKLSCDLKDNSRDEILKQYTPKRYKAVMASRRPMPTRTHGPNTQYSAATQASLSSSSSQQGVAVDISDRKETEFKITKTRLKRPEPTPKQQDQAR